MREAKLLRGYQYIIITFDSLFACSQACLLFLLLFVVVVVAGAAVLLLLLLSYNIRSHFISFDYSQLLNLCRSISSLLQPMCPLYITILICVDCMCVLCSFL